jgi:hypothetical protein
MSQKNALTLFDDAVLTTFLDALRGRSGPGRANNFCRRALGLYGTWGMVAVPGKLAGHLDARAELWGCKDEEVSVQVI